MKMHTLAIAVASAALLAACGGSDSNQDGKGEEGALRFNPQQLSSPWFREGAQVVNAASKVKINNEVGAAKNVILFVGDGMGIS
ncbi:MAG: hypothetical protein ACPG8O_09865, partial [Alcanivorax nanhaiticus]